MQTKRPVYDPTLIRVLEDGEECTVYCKVHTGYDIDTPFASLRSLSNRRQQSNTTWHGSPVSGSQSPKVTPERLKGTTQDLFDLLEKAQRSRIDDQRCMLPSSFNQEKVPTAILEQMSPERKGQIKKKIMQLLIL
ncbi:unnamed protein product [Phyllotreta striolata]|uniref:Uncharacterized protein n=1 Tax=Phyllotreta striolata TaxID=444603 RepID=A0A9N9XUM3_PHYSR|nr:unnamed protein product [Phyllotreta striolata]